ncbi:Thioredoxin H-type [Camellia lanceoleosa]|uniref:Thioredoxin H-type n=1 Tax=Camellia lanceoleosa TaxID=1840588 RepID=A0ACC0G470_9ERIC|nr:Thioredoxin H-type [Camellia lanceoleosa]
MGGSYSDLGLDNSGSEADDGSITTLKTVKDWENKVTESKTKQNKLIVVDFTASWCIFCKIIAPAVKEYAQKYTDVDFLKIDMTSPQTPFMDVARKYDVRGYPTFIMMKNGENVEKVIGANKEELKRAIEKHKA